MTKEDNSSEKLCWFAARTRNGQELSVRKTLSELGIEHFIPTKEGYREYNGRRVSREIPVIPCLVFLRATKADACALANGRGVPVWYVIDRSIRSMLVVPDKQMEDFRRVLDVVPDALCPVDTVYAPGDRVQVIKGGLKGIEGDIIQEQGRSYVVVSLGNLLCAKVKIPKSYLKLVKTTKL